MPQELHVVKCYKCSMFQVDIVKKIPKWTCKMCGEKQSLQKVFLIGSGKECRLAVQQLNEQRITKNNCGVNYPEKDNICTTQKSQDTEDEDHQAIGQKQADMTGMTASTSSSVTDQGENAHDSKDPITIISERGNKHSNNTEGSTLNVQKENLFENEHVDLDLIFDF